MQYDHLDSLIHSVQHPYLLLYSGKSSNGANFHIIRKHAMCAKIKTFENLFWTHVSTSVKVRRWHFVSLRSKSLRFRVRTALCPVLSLLLLLKTPTWRLSSVLISVLKLKKPRGTYTKFTPENQAAIAKYAFLHGRRTYLAMAYLANLANLANAPCVRRSTLHVSNGVWL